MDDPVAPATSDESLSGGLRESVLALERRLIARALTASGWNRSEAARQLKISYPSLLSKIKLFGLSDSR